MGPLERRFLLAAWQIEMESVVEALGAKER